MKKIILALAAAGALSCMAAPVLAGPVSGAVIGAAAARSSPGPPGAVVGGVIGAVVGGPNVRYYHITGCIWTASATTTSSTAAAITTDRRDPAG